MIESDYMLIEECLDGQLTPAQRDALQQRLAQDTILAKALESARQRRNLREAAMESYHPTDVEASVLARTALERCYENEFAPLAKMNRSHLVLRWTRRAMAIAACLLIAAGSYWLGCRSQLNPVDGYQVIINTDAGQTVKKFATLDQAKQYADSYQAVEPSGIETSTGNDNPNQLSMTGEF